MARTLERRPAGGSSRGASSSSTPSRASDDDDFVRPTALPGWTRRHLVAHVAANADALGNLVRWAATGRRTPMYATPEERAAGIEQGARMSADELRVVAARRPTTRLAARRWTASPRRSGPDRS